MKTKQTRTFAVLVSSLVLTLWGCKDSGKTDSDNASPGRKAQNQAAKSGSDDVRIVAATYPVAWLGCQIVGNPCTPDALVPPGASAHSWEPKPSDMQRMEAATVYIQSGLAFEEAWIPRFRSSIPGLEVVDARGALDLHAQEHRHGGGKGHSSEESDPHVWSSPRAMDRMADFVAAGVLQVQPDLRGRVDRNLPQVHAKLLELDTAVRGLFAPYSGKTFLVNHPGLGYLARDYGLVQKALESHGQELTPVALWEARKAAKAHGVRAVFVQSEYSRRTAEKVAKELGIDIVEVDLLGDAPYDSLFLFCAKAMAERL